MATPIATLGASPTSTPTPIPTVHQPSLAIDEFAEVVTTDLVVRSAPGTGQDSDILGKVANLPVIVLDGPVQADGYEWWLIRPIDSDGFEPPPAGWVAAGGQGEVWLASMNSRCEESPTSDALWAMPSAMWVGCYADVELMLRGTLDGCYSHVGPGGSGGCVLRNCAPEVCQGTFDDRRVIVDFQPLPVPDKGRIRITGHFDEPEADYCGNHADPLWRLDIFPCRTIFNATSYRFAD